MSPYSRVIILFGSGFFIVLLLIILLVNYSLKQFSDLQKQVEVVESEFHIKTESLSNFAKNSHVRTVTLLKMYNTNDPFERNELFDHFHALAHVVATANRTFSSFSLPDNEKTVHQEIFKRMKQSSNLRSHIADLLIEGEDSKAIELIVNQSVPAQERVLLIINKLQQLHKTNHKKYLDDIHFKQKENFFRIAILGFALFIIFSIQVIFVLRYILAKENYIVKRSEVTLDALNHIVITTNPSGQVDYINPYGNVVLKSINCDAMGKHFDALNLIHKKGENEPISDIVSNSLKHRIINQHFNQCYIKHHNNATFWVAVTITSILSKKGDFLGLAIIMSDISEVHALNEKLKQIASHDSLTGLYNRMIVEKKIIEMVENSSIEKSSAILFYLDLDNFKHVNDSAGHPGGDQLLIDFSQLLKKQIRDYDIVGRIGGDEFAILLYRCTIEQAKDIANKIINTVKNYRLSWEEEQYRVGVSIGITHIDGQITDVKEVTKKADKALYDAKYNGKNCYAIN